LDDAGKKERLGLAPPPHLGALPLRVWSAEFASAVKDFPCELRPSKKRKEPPETADHLVQANTLITLASLVNEMLFGSARASETAHIAMNTAQ
jgi:hypothetical protein